MLKILRCKQKKQYLVYNINDVCSYQIPQTHRHTKCYPNTSACTKGRLYQPLVKGRGFSYRSDSSSGNLFVLVLVLSSLVPRPRDYILQDNRII